MSSCSKDTIGCFLIINIKHQVCKEAFIMSIADSSAFSMSFKFFEDMHRSSAYDLFLLGLQRPEKFWVDIFQTYIQ